VPRDVVNFFQFNLPKHFAYRSDPSTLKMSADDFDAKLLKLSEDFQAGLMIQSEFEARLLKLEQESAQPAAPAASGGQTKNVR
jgi:hypothetical protein